MPGAAEFAGAKESHHSEKRRHMSVLIWEKRSLPGEKQVVFQMVFIIKMAKCGTMVAESVTARKAKNCVP